MYSDPEMEKAWRKKYRKANREKFAERLRIYRAKNKEKVRKWSREAMRRRRAAGLYNSLDWYYRNKEKENERQRAWSRNNRARINAYEKAKMKSNPGWKLRRGLSIRMNEVLREYKGTKKATKTMALLGCTRPELVTWLEAKFKPGMTWDNHGVHGWHVDHIIPCASFDLTNPEQQKKCFHYTNLQPLWAHENIAKSDTITANVCELIPVASITITK